MATARWARGIARTSTDRRAAGSNPTIRTTMANNTVIPRTQHARRRKQLMRMAGNDAILILPAAPERVRSRDTHYPYRQDPDPRYLAGFPEPEAVLGLVESGRVGEGKSGSVVVVSDAPRVI